MKHQDTTKPLEPPGKVGGVVHGSMSGRNPGRQATLLYVLLDGFDLGASGMVVRFGQVARTGATPWLSAVDPSGTNENWRRGNRA